MELTKEQTSRVTPQMSDASSKHYPMPPPLDTAVQIPGIGVRLFRFNQFSRGVDLLPYIPEQHSFHPVAIEIVVNAFSVLVFPVTEHRKTGIELANCFVTEIKDVCSEVWEIIVRLPGPGHVSPGLLPHRTCIIPVFYPDRLIQ
jgi:hypothetical protein